MNHPLTIKIFYHLNYSIYATPCPVLFSELNEALFKYTERKKKQRVNFLSDFIIFSKVFSSIFI